MLHSANRRTPSTHSRQTEKMTRCMPAPSSVAWCSRACTRDRRHSARRVRVCRRRMARRRACRKPLAKRHQRSAPAAAAH
eukprot:scaffold3256_cov114-Isochrysis_galbana.AAC.23